MGLELDAIRNSLRLASRDTGGKSFIGWADLTEVLRDIEADTGRYYLLTYAAPAPEESPRELSEQPDSERLDGLKPSEPPLSF